MMRLTLAAMMLPAAAAAPTCTDASCCTAMVQGMCSGNTHDAAGKSALDTGYTAADVAPVDCSSGDGTVSGNTENKGATIAGRTLAACCQAVTPPPPPPPTWTCADMAGDGATTDDPVTNTLCGVGWEAAGTSTALLAAFDANIEAHKIACCTACAATYEWAAADGACAPHTVLACIPGQGYAAGDAADDALCTACPAGKFTAGSAKEACATCAAGNIVEAGAGNGIEITAGTTCTACATGKFDGDGLSSTVCGDDLLTACPAGEGYVAGTTVADASCVPCVVGSTFTAGTANEPCAPSTITCGNAGEGNVASTAANAANSCGACPENTYAAAGDDDCLETCADGFITDTNSDDTAVATAATACTACASGKFDHDGIPSTPCGAHATGITACPAGEGYVAASTLVDAGCVACVVGSTFTAGDAQETCVNITPETCAAGKGYASDATAIASDTAAACTDCAAGKSGAGGVGALAVCTDCAAGTFSAAGAGTCTACASGLTTAAAASTVIADCVDNSAYCLLAMADDATDSDTNGQSFACSAGNYAASNVMTAAVEGVDQCTVVPATGAAITDTATTCTAVAEIEAVTAVVGVTAVPVIVIAGPDTVATAVTAVNPVSAVAASCTVAAGAGGTCTMATPVSPVGSVGTTCPEPVVADAKVSGAAAAAPLAALAALVAAIA